MGLRAFICVCVRLRVLFAIDRVGVRTYVRIYGGGKYLWAYIYREREKDREGGEGGREGEREGRMEEGNLREGDIYGVGHKKVPVLCKTTH